jgi:hypothetical protein
MNKVNNKKKYTVTLDQDTVEYMKQLGKEASGDSNMSLGIRVARTKLMKVGDKDG